MCMVIRNISALSVARVSIICAICNFTFSLYNCHFITLPTVVLFCFIYLILTACKWLAPFAAGMLK